jgi:hypothetical protein
MKKKKSKSFESLVKTTFMLIQKGSKFRVGRKMLIDICNYCKEVGHWAKECEKKKVDSKKRREQYNIVEA